MHVHPQKVALSFQIMNPGAQVDLHGAIFFHSCAQNRLLLEESGQSFLKVFLCIFWKRDFESRGKETVCR